MSPSHSIVVVVLVGVEIKQVLNRTATRRKTERSELAEGSYPVTPTSYRGLLTHPPPSQPRVRHITQQMIIIISNSDNQRRIHSYRGSFDQMDVQIDGHTHRSTYIDSWTYR
jgi:hypothetical protein